MTVNTRVRYVVMVGMAVWMAVAAAGSVAGGPPAAVQPVGRAVAAAVVTQRQSIPAAAFVPGLGLGMDYENEGRYLTNLGAATGSYYTAVRLPQGSRVTRFTFYWYDTLVGVGPAAMLTYTPWDSGGTTVNMARAVPALVDAPGYGSTSDATITDSVIDNAQRGYWVVWALPASADVRGCGVVIEYTPPAAADSHFALSAAAFTPYEDGYDYTLDGESVHHKHSPGGGTAAGSYVAPVRLPDGATVTKMTFHWLDNSSTGQAKARLQRTEFGQGDLQDMAYAESSLSGTSGASSSFDSSINLATIDNLRYGYWVGWDLSADDRVGGRGVVIEYQAPGGESGVISSPAAPLKPSRDGMDYEDHGRYVFQKSGPAGKYVAALRLPDGATMGRVTFHWYDNSVSEQARASLRRTAYGLGNFVALASADSALQDAPGYGSSTDTSITYPTLNNGSFGYWVQFELPPTAEVRACGVVVELGRWVFLPVIARNAVW